MKKTPRLEGLRGRSGGSLRQARLPPRALRQAQAHIRDERVISLSLAQLQPKAGPAALAVLGADRAAVLLRDSAHDGEPQP